MTVPPPNPNLFRGDVDGLQIAESTWAAAVTQGGEYVIVVTSTIDMRTGGATGIVAQCPALEIADYIAHLHNLMLADPGIAKQILEHVAGEHTGQMKPLKDIFKSVEMPAEETGGYL